MKDYSSLPPVHVVLESTSGRLARERFGHDATVGAVRMILENERRLVGEGNLARSADILGGLVLAQLEKGAVSSLRPVLNLTGVILHTNLGRAQLPEVAIEAAVAAMRHTVALEYNLDDGTRGERDEHLRSLICELTGAEDATIVNNNAAAVLLALNSLACSQNVLLSRGEMVEIGGSFRMPDIIARAGCHLKEVGATNRTHRHDFEAAINEETALILKVHTSNYRIEGFTSALSTAELSMLAHEAGLPLMEDLGSGILTDLSAFGLSGEPSVREVIKAGADLVTFSGDKLLGGPQAGFIVGRADLISRINKNPMKRAMRVDKIRLAALEAVLRLYLNPKELPRLSPTFMFLARTRHKILMMAQALCEPVQTLLGQDYLVKVCELESEVGSGAMPTKGLPSAGLAISAVQKTASVEGLQQRLRLLPVPVIGRLKHDCLFFDLRCVEGAGRVMDALEKLKL